MSNIKPRTDVTVELHDLLTGPTVVLKNPSDADGQLYRELGILENEVFWPATDSDTNSMSPQVLRAVADLIEGVPSE
ncbi:hypothetical protein [Mycetocola saprophilus]|uniref:hypothetical protein n=1 Tax=Mycetocola saprophilus TaxID=76636 RepID=UPI0004C1F4C4|nr:hypothetical protein [Mycetocola saprophilus]